MGNSIGFKGWPSVVNRPLILRALNSVKPLLYLTTPPSTLQVHILEPLTTEPPFAFLARRVLLPPVREWRPVRRRRQEVEEGGEGQVVVAGKEDVLLPRVTGGQRHEEIDDLAGVGTAVAVVAEEDYGGGFEFGSVDAAFEVRP